MEQDHHWGCLHLNLKVKSLKLCLFCCFHVILYSASSPVGDPKWRELYGFQILHLHKTLLSAGCSVFDFKGFNCFSFLRGFHLSQVYNSISLIPFCLSLIFSLSLYISLYVSLFLFLCLLCFISFHLSISFSNSLSFYFFCLSLFLFLVLSPSLLSLPLSISLLLSLYLSLSISSS